MTEISQEAVKAHALNLVERTSQRAYDGKLQWKDIYPTNQERYLREAEAELQKVVPAIQAQVLAGVRERLTSEKVINALASHRYAIGGTGVRYEDLHVGNRTRQSFHDAAELHLEQVAAVLATLNPKEGRGSD